MLHDLTELSIIVIHYQTPELLRECIERLHNHAPEAQCLVVDTAPDETTKAWLAQDFPNVSFVETKNHSLAHAVNVGLKHCNTPFIAHMNADVFIEADTFPKLLEHLDKPHVGMVGPQCRDNSGHWQNQGLPYRFHHQRLKYSQQNAIAVPWLTGCLQMLKREVALQVGGMNSSLRFYNEDIEWCWRIRQAAWQCQLVKTEVLHLGGSSTPKDKKFIIEGFRGGYVLSSQYKTPWYRFFHRMFIKTLARWHIRFGKTTVEREAYKVILELFQKQSFSKSPFSDTLQDEISHIP